MTAVSKWRARGYWAAATVLLPVLNPLLLVLIGALLGSDTRTTLISVALCICVANWLVLRVIAARTWRETGARRWRVALGVTAAIALSFAFGYAELIALILIACPDSGCFN